MDERPLPSGWSKQVDGQGRTYYIDHNTKRTTWDDPRNDPAIVGPKTEMPLPEGWEEKTDASGNVYFIDHNTKRTTWDDPRKSAPAMSIASDASFRSDTKDKPARSRIHPARVRRFVMSSTTFPKLIVFDCDMCLWHPEMYECDALSDPRVNE